MGRWGDGERGRELRIADWGLGIGEAIDSEAKRLARPSMPKPLAKDLRVWRLERGMGVSFKFQEGRGDAESAKGREEVRVDGLLCFFAFFASLRRIYSLIYVEEFIGAE